MENNNQANGASSTHRNEFLSQWKTSVGAFVVGVIANALLGAVAGGMPPSLLVLPIAYTVGVVVYALGYYPSLFKDGAHARSSAAVSFGNAFFGGLLFGAIWNSCLTNGKIGVSHYVYIGILAAIFVLSFAAAYYARM